MVRVLPPLTHQLAEAMPSFGLAIAPAVEHVAGLLAAASPYDVNSPSVLTKEKHRAVARRQVGPGKEAVGPAPTYGPNPGGLPSRAKARQRPPVTIDPHLPARVCRDCGGALPEVADRNPRSYCTACLARRRAEQVPALYRQALSQAETFAKLTGVRPTHTPEATTRRQAANSSHRAEQRAWEANHGGEQHDPNWFRSHVLPGLAEISLPKIAQATGISISTASKIRAGRRVPHPRHWEALAILARRERRVSPDMQCD